MADTPTTYLLEVGTEELPVSFLESAAWELKEKLQDALTKNRLNHGAIEIMQTPRRLAILIEDLAPKQTASEEEMKGPPISVGLDAQGNPTQAALGFAKKMGTDASQLVQKEIDGTPYLVYTQKSSGQPVEAVLPDILPDVVLSLSGSHFMAWDKSDIKFSRPIRWLVSLLGDKHLPLQIGLTQSGQVTRGHRFFAQSEAITIPQVGEYVNLLWKEGHVIVNQKEREKLIVDGLAQKAKDLNGTVPPNEDLLYTVSMLVESPSLVVGQFDPTFLTLPKEVITTVMAAHQKYFPVENPNTKELLPYFITISNNTSPEAEDSIRLGNEKVLRARLEDASFFFAEDKKRPLADYMDNLKGITFQKGLGSLYDKSQRLKSLAGSLSKLLSVSDSEKSAAVRAAELCKADLATNLVRELTELQGIMGRQYARISNEPDAVAEAIAEHYQPRFMGDAVAQSVPGIVLSLADKLDTMVAVFAQKDARYPTGSKDPMGLRRMALGIIQTVLENKIAFDLEAAFTLTYSNLGALAVESEEDTLNRTRQFLLQRLKGYLLEQSYSYDAIDAILECDVSPFADLNQAVARLNALKTLQQSVESFKAIYEPANRISRILGKAYRPEVQAQDIKPALFEHETEGQLFASYQQHASQKPVTERIEDFVHWAAPVEAFFNHVMVNVENPEVKENRYNLLSLLNYQYRQFADFTKLVI